MTQSEGNRVCFADVYVSNFLKVNYIKLLAVYILARLPWSTWYQMFLQPITGPKVRGRGIGCIC